MRSLKPTASTDSWLKAAWGHPSRNYPLGNGSVNTVSNRLAANKGAQPCVYRS
jgi:hypothetical protein